MAGYGAYGKMPALGDFFRINAGQVFVDTWDAWLQAGMVEASAALADRWHDCFMTAPIWRFTLSAGVAGRHGMLGVMMPSVDRVGRLFPLTIAVPLGDAQTPLMTHFNAGKAFASLEEIALDALDDDMTRDLLEDRLSGVPPVLPVQEGTIIQSGTTTTLAAAPGEGVLPLLGAHLAGRGLHHPCVWSAVSDAGDRMMIADGLPAAGQVRSLFDIMAPVWGQTAMDGILA